MKIVRFMSGDDATPRWGMVEDEQVHALGSDPLKGTAGDVVGPLNRVRLLSPCVPRKIVGLGINFPGATGQTAEQREPLVFLKSGNAATGPFDDIRCPWPEVKVWGECELAVVIGKRLRAANVEQARAGILGYTAANDVTAENINDWDHHLARAKSADTFCPLGPWIDTGFSPDNRRIEGYQNGELIRQGDSNQRLWRDAEAVAWLSTWMTLDPWDVILTGAPVRVVPKRYLNDGDEYVVRVEGLGELRNRFRVQRHAQS